MSTPEKTAPTPKKAEKPEEIDFDALLAAVKDVLIEKNGIRATARAYNLPKSTLEWHTKKVKESFDDVASVSDSVLMGFIRRKRMHLPSNMV